MNYIALIPTIINLIKAVEVFLPQSAGVDKLNAVLSAIQNIIGAGAEVAPQLTPLINATVQGLNALGVLKKA